MSDVTICDKALVSRARAIARDGSRPWRMRAAAWLVAVVFRARLALGLSARGRSRLRFRYWGRWCGPGYGGGDPIDALDCACRDHDRCYEDVEGPHL